MPSSPSQNPDEPSGLLTILVSVFSGFLFGLFFSKLDTPAKDNGESVHPKNNPRPETTLGQLQVPAAPQIPPTPTKQYYPDRRKDNTPRWKKWTEIVAVGIAGGLLIANGFVTVGTWKAAKATKDSVDLARKNAHFDQRAWLGISYGPQTYKINEPFAVTLEVVDTGRTPSRNVNGVAVTYFLKTGEKIPPFIYDHRTSIDLGTMLPGIKQSAVSHLIPIGVPKDKPIQPLNISDSMYRALTSGSGYILVYGRLEYDSVFGAHHWITFCASNLNFVEPKECIDYNDVDRNEEP
jgi:hypothetical protein